jgi:hypothetical protein
MVGYYLVTRTKRKDSKKSQQEMMLMKRSLHEEKVQVLLAQQSYLAL